MGIIFTNEAMNKLCKSPKLEPVSFYILPNNRVF